MINLLKSELLHSVVKFYQTTPIPKPQPQKQRDRASVPKDFGVDMSFWRKIVNDYREGFHGVISQPKSPKIANFGKPSENCWQ